MNLLRAGIVVFLCWCSSVWAGELVVARSWVEDPGGRMTLEQVRQAPQTPLSGQYFGHGFSASTFWIRLRIDPQGMPEGAPSDRLIVRIRPVYLDEVELHDPLREEAKPAVTGDRYSWLDDAYRSLNLNLVIARGSEPRDIWLRLKSTTSTLSSIEVLSTEEAQSVDWVQAMVTVSLLAVLCICLGWGALAWLLMRDRLIKLYLVRELVVIFYAVATLGGLRMAAAKVLAPEWIDALTNVLFITMLLVSAWFQANLLEVFEPWRWLLRFFRWTLWIFGVALVALAMGHTLLAIQINSLGLNLAVALDFLTALSTQAWKREDPKNSPLLPKWLLMTMYVPLVISVALHRLPAWNLMAPSDGVFYLLLVYPIASSLWVMTLLHVRAYRLQKRQTEVQAQLQFAEKTLNSERSQRQEQERFLSMLTHELKTPVSVARISLDAMGTEGVESHRIARALQNINDVVDRCQVSAAMENDRLTMKVKEFELRELLFERIDVLVTPERVKVSEGNEAWLRSDSHLVGIVISNLLDNALKYAAENSEVTVSVLSQMLEYRSGFCLSVANEVGPAGFPDGTQIFQKYYRSKAAQSQSGSGLGLYLCTGLTSMLGGHLQYQRAGDQVEFHFWLPV